MEAREKWVEEVLNSTDNIKKADAGFDVYNTVMQRVKEGSVIKMDIQVSTQTTWSIAAAIAIMIALNVATCAMFANNKPVQKDSSLKAFAMELNPNAVNYNY